ncbi:MAG: sulfotransferase [Acidimicrobiales bacterium]
MVLDEAGALSIRGEPSANTNPIFLVGCHRSGTSLLRMLFDTHPRISAGGEDISIYWFSQMNTDAWRAALSSYGFTEVEWLDTIRGVIEELHGRYAAGQGKTRWAQKCPENSLVLDYLDKLYPACQVIHIVRNPRDVIASNIKKYGRTYGPRYGKRWVNHVQMAETVGARLGPDRFRTIRYEDLVFDTEGVLKDLFAWVGEEWSPEVLRFGERTHGFPIRLKTDDDKKFVIHTESVGRGRESGPELVAPMLYVKARGGALAKKFGYDLSLGKH